MYSFMCVYGGWIDQPIDVYLYVGVGDWIDRPFHQMMRHHRPTPSGPPHRHLQIKNLIPLNPTPTHVGKNKQVNKLGPETLLESDVVPHTLHWPNTTTIHTHGLHMDPGGIVGGFV